MEVCVGVLPALHSQLLTTPAAVDVCDNVRQVRSVAYLWTGLSDIRASFVWWCVLVDW